MAKHDVPPRQNDEVTIQDSRDIRTVMPNLFPMPFIRFSMTRTSMFSDGKNTQVEGEEHRFENGRLDSRYFEGILAGDYLKNMTQLMEQQMEWFFKSFSFFLPFK